MKPTNKLQREVVELSKELYVISKQQKEWAYKGCLPHLAYANKSSAFCLDCGESFSLELVKRKAATCPNCQTKLKVIATRKTTSEFTNYFAITEVLNDFQIVRNFELKADYKKGNPVKHYMQEILQYWIQPDLKTTMFGLSHNTQSYCDSWSGRMEIRIENKRSWQGAKYDVYARKYHPDSEIKKEYLKYGINHNLSGLTFLEAIKFVPRNTKLETLLKAKQYQLLSKGESYQIDSFWKSIKICLRNKYKVSDVSIYFDYLNLLKYFKKDLSNSFYVCPKNLKKQHDRLMKRKRVILETEERERNRLQAVKRQEKLENAIKEYIERNHKFFDLEIVKDKISIKLLKSVEEFKEEGDELHHCVYTNEYYLKENSLIFSARVNGKRAETIELKLDKMKIEQSRGISNKPSKYNAQIVALMNKNISKIRNIIKKSTIPKQILQQSA